MKQKSGNRSKCVVYSISAGHHNIQTREVLDEDGDETATELTHPVNETPRVVPTLICSNNTNC